jgi:hypothetical protein
MGLYGSNKPGLDLERLINQSYLATLEIILYQASGGINLVQIMRYHHRPLVMPIKGTCELVTKNSVTANKILPYKRGDTLAR